MYILLLLCTAFSPWGDLMRFGATTATGGERGITTILALAFTGWGLWSGRTKQAIQTYPTALCFLAFLLVSGAASLFASEARQAVAFTLSLGVYFLVAFSVAGLRLQKQEILQLLTVFAVSSTLMCFVSLIDYFGLVNLYRVNPRQASRGLEVANLLGPFYSQTAMGAHLSLAFPIPCAFIFFRTDNKIYQKLFWVLCFATISLAGILTYSRGLIVSFVIVMGYLFYVGKQIKGKNFWYKNLVTVSLTAVITIILFQVCLPNQYEALLVRLNDTTPTAIQNSDSDKARFGGLESTLNDLAESPWGVGFSDSQYQIGARLEKKNAHNTLVDVLRAGGYLGLVLFLMFIGPIFIKSFQFVNPQIETPLFSALASFFFYGLTHTIFGTLFAWILAGVSFYIITIERKYHKKFL